MAEIVEGRISADMKDSTRGLILNYGWTKGGVHFVAIFECYTKKVGTYSSSDVIEEPHMFLLDCSPMHQIEAYDGEN